MNGGSPRPTIEHREEYEPAYPVEDFIVPLLRRWIDEALEQYAAGVGEPLVLDVGCGEQPWRARLSAKGYRYTSFDAMQSAAGTVDVIGTIDAELPEELRRRGPFDLILCTEVLEHVLDWNAAFANLASLLRTRGRLIVTCPHFYPGHEEPYDFWRPTSEAVRQHAEKAGLETLVIERCGDAWDVLGTLLTVSRFRARTGRPLALVLATAAQLASKLAGRLLRIPALRSRVALRGPLYLSVGAVFEKVSAP